MWFLSASHRARFLALAELESGAVRSHLGSMPIAPPPELGMSRRALRREMGLDRFTLLFLGRLVPVKGVDLLLHAAARAARPVHVRIAGDGPARAALEALARRLGVDAHFEGWVSGQRKEQLLVACDAMVAPSRPGDGLPTVLFEAKARSMPIIASRVGAIPTRLREAAETRLVAPGDPNALVDAIDSLAAAPDRAQGWTRSVPLGGL
jgi:glycosyltransferase involved in cell wall biosynthesis